MGLAIGRRKVPATAEMPAAILEGGARVFEVLDAVVERDDAGDFLAQLPAGFAAEQVCAVGTGRGGQITQNSPFRARFAHLAWNFRTEHDAAFRARLGAA